MELRLFKKTTIKDLKMQFSRKFPYLKLEFFACGHNARQGSGSKQKLSEQTPLFLVDGVRSEGVFSFQATLTVSEFEQKMRQEFGLGVRILRKADGGWIDTSQTSDLALDMQNKVGQVSSQPRRTNPNNLFL